MFKKTAIFFLIVALLGFLDALYLTIQHYLGAIPPCLITDGCSTVLTSKWSMVAGVPVALFGAVYYLAMLVLAVIYLKNYKKGVIVGAAFASALGFIASVWFLILQFFIIKQICFYCTISAVTSTTLFITGLFILLKPSSKLSPNSKVDDVLKKID